MIDIIYHLGIMCIQYFQEIWKNSEDFIVGINNTLDTVLVYRRVLPILAVYDSVFAQQFLIVFAGNQYINIILKWILAEHRPYWWVHVTDYYEHDGPEERPMIWLDQYAGSCRMSAGSPSGHATSAAAVVVLVSMWAMHVAHDRKWRIPNPVWWLIWAVMSCMVLLVCNSQLVMAAHFPHQLLLGLLIGFVVTPLIVFATDTYIWRVTHSQHLHVIGACLLLLAAVGLTGLMRLIGSDPQWSLELALKYCIKREHTDITSTPLFSLSECSATLFGWAIFVSPRVKKYRHNTKERSLIIAAICMYVLYYILSAWQEHIPKHDNMSSFANYFALYFVRVGLFMKIVPFAATLPWRIEDYRMKRDLKKYK